MTDISFMYIPPTQVTSVWEDISPGVEKCIEKGGLGIHTLDLVLSNLVKGEWTLWMIYLEGDLIGFYILYILPKSHVEIAYGYIESCITPKERYDTKEAGLKEIERIARAFKCSKILAYSTRIGMSTYLSSEMGYSKEMVVYCKELQPTWNCREK